MFGLTPYNKRNRDLKCRPTNIFEEMDAMVENFFGNAMSPIFANKLNQMHVDIKENDTEYILEAELPGVDKDEMKVELNNNTLTVSVERNEEIKEEQENYIRQERRYGSMVRSFYVENIKDEEINADYNNGILSIKLPKDPKGNPGGRKININ